MAFPLENDDSSAFQTIYPQPNSSSETPIANFQHSRYRVISELGSGTYGIVLKAEDCQLGRLVAIKLERQSSQRKVETFQHEARMTAAVKHPGVVPIYDIASLPDGRTFIVSEFLEGGNLETLLAKQGTLSIQETCRICASIARALHHIHQSGLVHRDLKPANILLDRSGKPIIADLGLALTDSDQALRAGEVAGTPAYMAPEQCLGKSEHLDGRADLWALGVMMYEMLVGRRPFVAANSSSLIQEILHRDPKPLRMQSDKIPEPLIHIVNKCLAKSPQDRFACGNDVALALEKVAARLPSHSSTVRWFPVKRRWILAAMLILLVASLAVYYNSQTVNRDLSQIETTALETSEAVLGSLRVQDFSVYISPTGTTSNQAMLLLGDNAWSANENDGAKLRIQLNRAAYAYLLALNPNSTINLCHPYVNGSNSDWQLVPEKLDNITFPQNQLEFYQFTDGAGTQAFLLLVSDTPLPAFSTWLQSHPDFQWKPPTSPIFIRPLTATQQTLGSVAQVPGTASLAELIERLSSYHEIQRFELWAFPVVASDIQ